jgi:ParB family chromosome partitioning protein
VAPPVKAGPPAAGRISIDDRIVSIKIERIRPDPKQPRKFFDEETLGNLKNSIESESLHDPILVRKDSHKRDCYIIVDGQRRWQACLDLRHKAIQCRIVQSDAKGYQILSLTQNIHRDDLLPIEKANAFAALYEIMLGDNQKARQKELLRLVNVSESFVSELLKISSLDAGIKAEAEKSRHWTTKKLLGLSRIKDPLVREARYRELKEVVDRKILRHVPAGGRDPGPPEGAKPDSGHKAAEGGGSGASGAAEGGGSGASGAADDTISLGQLHKRINFWKRYIEKARRNPWEASEIEAIKKDLQSLLDVFN